MDAILERICCAEKVTRWVRCAVWQFARPNLPRGEGFFAILAVLAERLRDGGARLVNEAEGGNGSGRPKNKGRVVGR